MTNIFQSSQNKSTCAPGYFNNYLQQLATCAQKAGTGAQYVGAQPLQQKAFCQINATSGAAQPAYQTGMGYIGCAAQSGSQIGAAANPYLQAATGSSPLCAAQPLICEAQSMNLGKVAQCYMNPFLNNQAQTMSDIAQRNIQMNLGPAVTGATVGSGQFGSQRGAQALGQAEANAEQCLNAQMANLYGSAYGQALGAAGQKESALGQLAQTTSSAQAAQNQAQLQAAQEAANAKTQQAQAEQAAGLGMGTLATQKAQQNLACINALATLGAQCQAIKQNAQCYALSKMCKESNILRGQAIPTTVKTTMCPSLASAATTGLAGLQASGLLGSIGQGLGNLFGCAYKNFTGCTKGNSQMGQPNVKPQPPSGETNNCAGNTYRGCGGSSGCSTYAARGGLIHAKPQHHGCFSTRSHGALPVRRK